MVLSWTFGQMVCWVPLLGGVWLVSGVCTT